jgi:hypothetical protein
MGRPVVDVNKTFEWDTDAPAADRLAVLRALEPQLLTAIKTIPGLRSRGFFIASSGGNLHNVPAEELIDSLAQSGRITALQVEYDNYFSGQANIYTFYLWLNSHGPDGISVKFEGTGPQSNESTGIFENIRRRIEIEIERQKAASWKASPLEMPKLESVQKETAPSAKPAVDEPRPKTPEAVTNTIESAPPAPVSQDTNNASQPNSTPGFWRTLTTHPLPVTVIGTTVAGGIIYLIGLLIQHNDSEENKPPPPPTTSQTSITPTNSSTTSTTPTLAPPPASNPNRPN